MGDRLSVINYESLRTGNTDFGKWTRFKPSSITFRCETCQRKVNIEDPRDKCPYHPRGIHCIETRKTAPSYGDFEFHRAVRTVVFDEVHRCNGLDSLNADVLIGAKRQAKKILAISATPAHSPLHMKALGYALDLHNLKSDKLIPQRVGFRVGAPSFESFIKGYGCRWDQRFHGFKWMVGQAEQLKIMNEIRASIVPSRGVRVRGDDIPGFPQRDIQAELYDLESPERVNAAYARMAEAVGRLNEKKASDVNEEHPLTKMLRARQEVELLKVPVFAELAQSYLDQGFSVCCFVNYRQTIDELSKIFNSFGVIDGQTKDRDGVVDRFQSNILRLLFINSEAGGISLSLHDLFGGFPRMGLVSPTFSAVTLRQIFGRFQREGGKSRSFYRVIFAAGTVEMPIYRAVRPKLNNIDALTDGDLTPDNLQLN